LSRFLELAEVLVLHDLALELDGGSAGVLSQAALESAVAQPQAEAFGQLLHATLYEQAAAYLFHLSKAHAFVDGNKRTAFLAMVTFLQMNGLNSRPARTNCLSFVWMWRRGNSRKRRLRNGWRGARANRAVP